MAKGSKEQPPKTQLDAAFAAYQAGDMVSARRLAKPLLSREPTAQEADAAKRVGKELFATKAEADAKAVATELIARIRPWPRVYAFAAVAISVWGLLALYASTRG